MVKSNIAIPSLTLTPGIGQLIAEWGKGVDPTPLAGLTGTKLAAYELWVAASNNRDLAVRLGDTIDTQRPIPNLPASSTRYAWVRARDNAGNYGDFFPPSSTAGIAATTGTILPPNASITEAMLKPNIIDAEHVKSNAITADKINVTNLAAISATLGNVVVNGNLIVNGSLTTTKYRGGSVSVGSYGEQSGTKAITTSTTANTGDLILSESITCDGGRVLIIFNALAYGDSPDGPSFFRVFRGSTKIGEIIGNYWFDSTFGGGVDPHKSFMTTGMFEDVNAPSGLANYILYAARPGTTYYVRQGRMYLSNFKV